MSKATVGWIKEPCVCDEESSDDELEPRTPREYSLYDPIGFSGELEISFFSFFSRHQQSRRCKQAIHPLLLRETEKEELPKGGDISSSLQRSLFFFRYL